MRPILMLLFLITATVSVFAQTVAITNAKIYPVSGPPIAKGTIVIKDGLIATVGDNVTVPAGAQTIDANGKVVTPGLINSLTAIGIIEIGQVRDTNDATAKGTNNIAASFRVWDGLNPTSTLFAPTRNEGVTTVIVVPRGGLISGQAAAIDLGTGHAADVLRRGPVAMMAQKALRKPYCTISVAPTASRMRKEAAPNAVLATRKVDHLRKRCGV